MFSEYYTELVIHAKMMGVGPASLSGAHRGYITSQLKTNMQRLKSVNSNFTLAIHSPKL